MTQTAVPFQFTWLMAVMLLLVLATRVVPEKEIVP